MNRAKSTFSIALCCVATSTLGCFPDSGNPVRVETGSSNKPIVPQNKHVSTEIKTEDPSRYPSDEVTSIVLINHGKSKDKESNLISIGLLHQNSDICILRYHVEQVKKEFRQVRFLYSSEKTDIVAINHGEQDYDGNFRKLVQQLASTSRMEYTFVETPFLSIFEFHHASKLINSTHGSTQSQIEFHLLLHQDKLICHLPDGQQMNPSSMIDFIEKSIMQGNLDSIVIIGRERVFKEKFDSFLDQIKSLTLQQGLAFTYLDREGLSSFHYCYTDEYVDSLFDELMQDEK